MPPNQSIGQNPVTNASAPVFVSYTPSASGQEQYGYAHSNFGSNPFATEGFAQPVPMQAYSLANLTASGYPFSNNNNNTIPPSAPPSDVGQYPTNTHLQPLNQPGTASSAGVSSSAGLSSHQPSIFDTISGSGYSHVNSSSNDGRPVQVVAIPLTTSNAVLSTWLSKNPFTISPSELMREVSVGRYQIEWRNWEKEFVIIYWVGPQADPHLVFVAMSTNKSPGVNDRLGKPWETVRAQLFYSRQY